MNINMIGIFLVESFDSVKFFLNENQGPNIIVLVGAENDEINDWINNYLSSKKNDKFIYSEENNDFHFLSLSSDVFYGDGVRERIKKLSIN